MITTITKAMTILFVVCSLIFTSCKKGDTGPQGTAGKDGNANVKSTSIFITGSEWVFSPGEATITKQISAITADIVNNGAVMVYQDGDALPATVTSTNGVVIAFGYSIEVGKLNLNVSWNASTTLTAADIGNNDFRIVIIAGSALRTVNPNTNEKNYEEVKAVYNLKD